MTCEDKRRWLVQDIGKVGVDNAVWLHCEHIEARDNIAEGTTVNLTFKTGAGRSIVEVTRLNDDA
jgi:hypothetical protein